MNDLIDLFQLLAFGAQTVGAGMQARGEYDKSTATRTAYSMQADIADTNATIDRARSADAITRGQSEAARSGLRARQLKGEQIARMAANGVALDEGSPLNILSDTDYMAELDANTIAKNALKEAWGFAVAEDNDRSNANLLRYRASQENPTRAATTSLLTSAASVASKWYTARRPYGYGDA